MNLLISIKPTFVEKIISKEKRYEFRKSIFRKKVNKIFIYSTAPEKKIIGYFEPHKIIKDNPANLWDFFSDEAGISEKDFFKYFEMRNEGYAIKIDNLRIFDNPIDVSCLKDFNAPQSFKYVNNFEI